MDLKFIDAGKFVSNIKLTIHKNGRLGFSENAINILNINTGKSVQFAKTEEDNDNFYIIVFENERKSAFKIHKAGNYYYLRTKEMFDNMGLDYRNNRIIFDVVKTEEKFEQLPIYKLIKREVRKKQQG